MEGFSFRPFYTKSHAANQVPPTEAQKFYAFQEVKAKGRVPENYLADQSVLHSTSLTCDLKGTPTSV